MKRKGSRKEKGKERKGRKIKDKKGRKQNIRRKENAS